MTSVLASAASRAASAAASAARACSSASSARAPATFSAATAAAAVRVLPAVRGMAGGHGHGHGDHHDDGHELPAKLHKEEYLKVAREWPLEQLSPYNGKVPIEDELASLPHAPEPTGFDWIKRGEATPTESWSAPFWTRLLLAAVTGVALFRVNEYYTRDAPVHPLMALIDQARDALGGGAANTYEYNAKAMPLRQRAADDRLIFNTARLGRTGEITRVSFVDFHTRASDRLIPVEPDIDFSDIEIKPNWKRHDKYLGVPYPKGGDGE
ncbi:hypothetical protein HK105_209372 [Polyrhizophydium stewartii]|uniref:Uncharacterized protein n=1 Tax=Polyrhizophydium stewartii TaxID=2732419 RepID=A0ABR4MVE6_9FUNG|nr:hypothetical protein HK105_006209 [Polyrhizophydium stewartii]